MKKAVLESPFAGKVERNVAYAKLCVRDMLLHGEAPIASHLLFTQPGVLDDNNPEQRKLGIAAGHAWTEIADYIVVYIDFGFSSGMDAGIRQAALNGTPIEFRRLPVEQLVKLKEQYPD
ncbi:MAG TPA: hypothetical protein VN855_00230 [Candidatus Acidoferrum sp.]|nr:hypothetical protein [Candidatus Acidoferrum sp.]